MRYRSMDHCLRATILEGARVEPSDVHPSWLSSQDQGVYETLRSRLDAEIQSRLGSDEIEADDILQEEMTKQVMLRRVGEVLVGRRFFREHVSVLGTKTTPLWHWLSRRVADHLKSQKRKAASMRNVEDHVRNLPETPERPSLTSFVSGLLVSDSPLGREVLEALGKSQEKKRGSSKIDGPLLGQVMACIQDPDKSFNKRDITEALGVHSSSVSSQVRRRLVPLMVRALESTGLMERIEDAYDRAYAL